MRLRLLRNVHESFALALSASFSTLLECEIGVRLDTIAQRSAAGFQDNLQAPSSTIRFQLEPRPEQAILSFDCATTLRLLELLLGGSLGPDEPGARSLTEIEWALLEDVVRALAATLGEAWKPFRPVEFKVLALESDPSLMPPSDPGQPVIELVFAIGIGDQEGRFRIGVPQSLFEADPPASEAAPQPSSETSLRRNLALLAEASVELEVILEGPAMRLADIAALKAGQVIQFDYPIEKSMRAAVNRSVSFPCQVVSAGRKRAVRVEALP